jgi:hypothetical protein
MAFKLCLKCGARWDTADARSYNSSYYFSSASHPKGSYVDAATIILEPEDILTCPLDPALNKASEGRTPSGARMATGDDRSTEGDETHPSKDEL